MGVSTFRRRPVRSRNNNDQELRKIYGDRDGKIPDLSRFEYRRKRRFRTVFFGFLLLLAFFGGVAWAGFFVFSGGSRVTGEGVAMTIEAPSELTSGDAVTWTIRYTNNERVPLGKVELNLYYPASFVFETATPMPSDERKSRWQLGSMRVGEEREVSVSGKLFDAIDTSAVLRAVLVYKPANFNSEFETIASSTITIARTPVTVTIDGPSEVTPGELVSYVVRLANTTDVPLDLFSLNLQYPSGFVLEKMKPDATREKYLWEIKKLNKGEEKTITIDGRFSGESGERILVAAAEREVNAKRYLLARREQRVSVSRGDLTINFFTGGDQTSESVEKNARVPFTVRLKNTSERTLVDIAVIAELNGSAFDWKAAENPLKGIIDSGTIRWTKREDGRLKKMIPGALVALDFSTPFIGSGSARGIATVTYLRAEDKQKTRELKSNAITISSGSTFDLAGGVAYVDAQGAPVGSGPFPPKVGETTTFRVLWTLRHDAKELQDIVVRTATVPSVVPTSRWKVSAGEFLVDSGTGALLWRVSRFPSDVPELTASFDLSVRPSAEDVGKAIPLTLKASFEAKDPTLLTTVGGTLSPLTTERLENETDKKKGIVVP